MSNKDLASDVIRASRTGNISGLRRIFLQHPEDKKQLANVKGRYVEVYHTQNDEIETEYYFTPLVFAIDAWVHEAVKLRSDANIIECIKFLLKNGANLKETITINGSEMTCGEFLKNRYNSDLEILRETYHIVI